MNGPDSCFILTLLSKFYVWFPQIDLSFIFVLESEQLQDVKSNREIVGSIFICTMYEKAQILDILYVIFVFYIWSLFKNLYLCVQFIDAKKLFDKMSERECKKKNRVSAGRVAIK